eukprot:COSAG02_NODE_25821_length_648_cov_0.739526_1_plen_158_part_01
MLAPVPKWLDPQPYWKTPAAMLTEAARTGWLMKQGHVVKNWKKRWCVLWPAAQSTWAQKHRGGGQLLVYYESPESQAPKGIVPLDPGNYEITNEHGLEYRGEPALKITLKDAGSAHKSYLFSNTSPEEPGEVRLWHELIVRSTGTRVRREQVSRATGD